MTGGGGVLAVDGGGVEGAASGEPAGVVCMEDKEVSMAAGGEGDEDGMGSGQGGDPGPRVAPWRCECAGWAWE